jgi:hypothetical protein
MAGHLLFNSGSNESSLAPQFKWLDNTFKAKMNPQEATRAGTVSGLRAGRTMEEIMSYGDFCKNTFCDDKWKCCF